MDNSSAAVIKPTQVKNFAPPLNLTRWQRFCAYLKTSEGALLPMWFLLVGSHIFVGHYLFSEEFLDDFEDDDDAPNVVKKMVTINKDTRRMFAEIREKFSAFTM